MIRRGFTVVELIVTITIMGILLTLAVVGLNATQVNGRDADRKGDVEAIASHLETYYRNDNPDFSKDGGTYLDTASVSETSLKEFLPDLDPKSIRAPGVDVSSPMSFVPATNSVTTPSGVLPKPSKSNDVYVYQPISTAGTRCTNAATTDCRRFNIFYYQESDNTIQVVTSKNQ